MPIRPVKPRSERGSIKDLKDREPDLPPTPFELRAKQMFEYAQEHKSPELMAQTGFITTDYIADKNALPLSVYRLRQVVDDIKSKSGGMIDQFSQEIEQGIRLFVAPDAKAYWDNKNARGQIKTASVRKTPSFWRVIR